MADEQPPNMGPSESARHDDDVFVAPPLAGDDLDDLVDPPGWPKVVGIISIVWGAILLTCAGCGVISLAFQGTFLQMAGADPNNPPPLTSLAQWVQGGFGTLWSVLLVIAGVTLLNRVAMSRVLHLIYAVGALILMIWGIKIQLDAAAAMAQWAQDNPDSPFAQSQQGAGSAIGQMAGLIIGIGIGAPWPLFCLIWFGFIKRTPEDMTAGLEPAA